MHKVIYTKSLDNASDLIAKSGSYDNITDAQALFKAKVNEIVQSALDNEFFNFKMSMTRYKAVIHIESVHHCIAIEEENV